MQSSAGDGGRCTNSRLQLTKQLGFVLSEAYPQAPQRIKGALRQCISSSLRRELVIGIVPFSSFEWSFFSGKAVVETLLDADARPVSVYLHIKEFVIGIVPFGSFGVLYKQPKEEWF